MKTPDWHRAMRKKLTCPIRSARNPNVRKVQKRVLIRVDIDTIEYFMKLAGESGIPYRILMGSYLAHCASRGSR